VGESGGLTLQLIDTALAEVKILVPARFGDARGYFSETYNKATLAKFGIDVDFIQDNHSLSRPVGTLRGLHFQRKPYAQTKLVRVLRGAIFDVAVDIRHGSPSFGQIATATLSAENGWQLFVPAGFAHAFVTLEPDTEVAYKVDNYYAPDCDGGIIWNDKTIGIEWPLPAGGPILSGKDAALPRLAELGPIFHWEPV